MFVRISHRFRLGALVVALACLLPACGSSSDDAAGAQNQEATVRTGGEAVYITASEVRNLEPASTSNGGQAGAPLMNAIFDVLYTIDPITGAFQPRVATSFESTDGRAWTLKLRDDVKFTDGTPLDAEAVRFSWDRMLSGEVPAPSSPFVQEIDTMTVTDPQTLVVNLKTPNLQFQQTLLYISTPWIVSPTAVRKQGLEDFAQHPVGAGPFMLKSRTPNAETVLVRNPNYWQPGLPKLDTLIMRPNPDSQQALDTILAGQAHAMIDTVGSLAQQARDAGLSPTAAYTLQGGSNFVFNQSRAPFDDVRARKAVSLALDPDELNQQVFDGSAEVVRTVFTEDSPFYDASLRLPSSQPEQAQALFNELAGEGKPVRFTITVGGGKAATYAKAIQTQLSAYDNVEAEVKQTDLPTFVVALRGHDFDLAASGSQSSDPEPLVYAALHSSGLNNFGFAKDPKIDEGLRIGHISSDEVTRRAGYVTFQQGVIESFPVIWTYRSRPAAVQASTVAGLRLYGQGSPLFENFGLIE